MSEQASWDQSRRGAYSHEQPLSKFNLLFPTPKVTKQNKPARTAPSNVSWYSEQSAHRYRMLFEPVAGVRPHSQPIE
jgi:hypothetical protein